MNVGLMELLNLLGYGPNTTIVYKLGRGFIYSELVIGKHVFAFNDRFISFEDIIDKSLDIIWNCAGNVEFGSYNYNNVIIPDKEPFLFLKRKESDLFYSFDVDVSSTNGINNPLFDFTLNEVPYLKIYEILRKFTKTLEKQDINKTEVVLEFYGVLPFGWSSNVIVLREYYSSGSVSRHIPYSLYSMTSLMNVLRTFSEAMPPNGDDLMDLIAQKTELFFSGILINKVDEKKRRVNDGELTVSHYSKFICGEETYYDVKYVLYRKGWNIFRGLFLSDADINEAIRKVETYTWPYYESFFLLYKDDENYWTYAYPKKRIDPVEFHFENGKLSYINSPFNAMSENLTRIRLFVKEE